MLGIESYLLQKGKKFVGYAYSYFTVKAVYTLYMEKFMQEGGKIYFNFYLNSDRSVNLVSQELLGVFFIITFISTERENFNWTYC